MITCLRCEYTFNEKDAYVRSGTDASCPRCGETTDLMWDIVITPEGESEDEVRRDHTDRPQPE